MSHRRRIGRIGTPPHRWKKHRRSRRVAIDSEVVCADDVSQRRFEIKCNGFERFDLTMEEKKLNFAFRLVHIDNIPHILKNGIVKADSTNANPNYVPIGDQLVIEKRKNKRLSSSSWQNIGDFIPFYFGPRSPMLYVIQHGYNGVRRIEAEDIVYCVIRLDDIIKGGIECCFTDGHVLNSLTQVFPAESLNRIESYVRYSDVYARRWDDEEDLDLKRRKEAELLLKNDLPVQYIKGFVVYNEGAMQRLISMGVNERMVAVRPTFYF